MIYTITDAPDSNDEPREHECGGSCDCDWYYDTDAATLADRDNDESRDMGDDDSDPDEDFDG